MKFQTVLEQHENMDATGITIPFDVEAVFGAKRVPVKVSINDAEYRTTIFFMGGRYMLAVPKVFRHAAGIKAGEKITVTMEKDTEKRTVEVPQDLAAALEKSGLSETFLKMSYTHQKEYVNSVSEAKREETRARRIEKTLEMLKEKKK
ncbi:MAG TPA: YdeI/OmpD-associated family protein [Pyrinomonadaceae bacterium]|jgi:bifunctional DNA-binding transcriptional regulator/antitoxin component of YhaV-PrlF toxin-antitoxin module